MSVKKGLKANTTAHINPIQGTKDTLNLAKRDLQHKPPGPDQDAAAAAELARQRQFEELAGLDEEENRRIKTLLSASRGARMYRGSPLTRATPGNRSGSAGGAVGGFGSGAVGAAAAAAVAGSAGAIRSSGGGGRSRASLIY